MTTAFPAAPAQNVLQHTFQPKRLTLNDVFFGLKMMVELNEIYRAMMMGGACLVVPWLM